MTAPAVEGGLHESIRFHATRLFAARGFAGTSIREVVEACNCTKPALYHYYRSKEALFRDVVTYHSDNITALIASTVHGQGSVRERLHAGLDKMIEHAMAQPYAMRLMQRVENMPEENAPSFDSKALREGHMTMLATLMGYGIESGELRPGIDPVDGALIIAGALHFQFERSIAAGDWDSCRIHRTIDIVLDGIAQS